MLYRSWKLLATALAALLLLAACSQPELFRYEGIGSLDGTETLGPPGIAIADGTAIVSAGVGLSAAQPGTIDITVPAGATVNQVLLYWSGLENAGGAGDDTATVNGSEVTGLLIGGPTPWFLDQPANFHNSAYRADITALGLIGPGANALTVGGLDFDTTYGAGVMVIISDGTNPGQVSVLDGLDLAFVLFDPPVKSTVQQTFSFDAASVDRTATLSMFFGSVKGAASGSGPLRPNSIEVITGGVTTVFSDELDSNDGEEWDTFVKDITIPAGATELSVQVFSRDDNMTGALEASLAWVTAGLSVPDEPGVGDGEGCTPGYWRQDQHFDSWADAGFDPSDLFSDVFGRTITVKSNAGARGRAGDVTDPDLLHAVWAQGGNINALARHAVAALLNAASPNVSYAFTTAEVIGIVQNAIDSGDSSLIEAAKDQLEAENGDDTVCPLN